MGRRPSPMLDAAQTYDVTVETDRIRVAQLIIAWAGKENCVKIRGDRNSRIAKVVDLFNITCR